MIKTAWWRVGSERLRLISLLLTRWATEHQHLDLERGGGVYINFYHQDGGSHHQLRALATGTRLRPELAGRRSPVGDGGDEEEGGVFQHQDFYSII